MCQGGGQSHSRRADVMAMKLSLPCASCCFSGTPVRFELTMTGTHKGGEDGRMRQTDNMMFSTHGRPVAQSMCGLCRWSQGKPRINCRQGNDKNKNWMVSRCSSQWMSIQRTSKIQMRNMDSNYSHLAGNILNHDTSVCPTVYKVGDNVWSSWLRKRVHHLDQLNSLSLHKNTKWLAWPQ